MLLVIIIIGRVKKDSHERVSIEILVYIYIYGKVQRGQHVSIFGGYFKMLTLAQAREV